MTAQENKSKLSKRELIIKYKGWDTCEHSRIRRFCTEKNKDGEICMYEVPAYERRKGPNSTLPTELNKNV